MKETHKSMALRQSRGDFNVFLKGSGIDIGCGNDPLILTEGIVWQWDLKDGDAQRMFGVSNESFDFVYSSHCLEHLRDIPEALGNWTRILRSRGFLYVVVPDYLYYEKLTWPSKFNEDHKHSFSHDYRRCDVHRENHWHIGFDLRPLCESLDLEWIRSGLEIQGFDFNRGTIDQTKGNALSQICFVARKL